MGVTCQCFKKWLVLSIGTLGVLASSLPITPACDILQSLVELSVFHVFGGHYARPTTSVNKIIEAYRASGTVFAFPSRRNRAAEICNLGIFWHVNVGGSVEVDRLDFDAVENLGAAFLRMPEDKLV